MSVCVRACRLASQRAAGRRWLVSMRESGPSGRACVVFCFFVSSRSSSPLLLAACLRPHNICQLRQMLSSGPKLCGLCEGVYERVCVCYLSVCACLCTSRPANCRHHEKRRPLLNAISSISRHQDSCLPLRACVGLLWNSLTRSPTCPNQNQSKRRSAGWLARSQTRPLTINQSQGGGGTKRALVRWNASKCLGALSLSSHRVAPIRTRSPGPASFWLAHTNTLELPPKLFRPDLIRFLTGLTLLFVIVYAPRERTGTNERTID